VCCLAERGFHFAYLQQHQVSYIKGTLPTFSNNIPHAVHQSTLQNVFQHQPPRLSGPPLPCWGGHARCRCRQERIGVYPKFNCSKHRGYRGVPLLSKRPQCCSNELWSTMPIQPYQSLLFWLHANLVWRSSKSIQLNMTNPTLIFVLF